MVNNKINRILAPTLAALMALMTINVLWQVFSRYILQSPSSFTDELARYLLIWLGMLGAAYAAGQGNHLAIDLLSDRLNGSQKIVVRRIISSLIITFVFAVMVIGGGRLVYITGKLNQTSAALHIPLTVVYAIIPISGILIILYEMERLVGDRV